MGINIHTYVTGNVQQEVYNNNLFSITALPCKNLNHNASHKYVK